MKLRIAARTSTLSRIQVSIVERKLNELGIETEFIGVKTRADLFTTEPLSKLGKGVFEKEVNEYVVAGKADLAVHSMKDLTSSLDNDLEILATIKRDSPFDVIIGKHDIYELGGGSVIGTSSVRRKNFVKFLREDVNVKDLRGNIDSRIRKLQSGEYDAIIVAEASILRLKADVVYHRLSPYDFTPEVNQGIIAIVGKKDLMVKEIKELNDSETFEEAMAERAASQIVGGGCHSPVGVLFRKEGDSLVGIMSVSDGKRKITVEISTNKPPKEAGLELGKKVLEEMKNEGLVL
ncbi:MAG: porphobilinogen deaminase [Candidatus Aramenus sulfurataquae]|jgi:hydroxymethylbilane synthase|uniref:Hydroxymethylbilane synthase n=2 Tax=Candidatus Aramenus sulfurataquae TaxID=1326980 RepID=W7L6U8_9CREN|nr:MAG: porphobilinogen deaminase [Candidatus Aramenus sulfurataquae]MCL7343250.1 hydroxymethylbilane synthase [Candidatus Aramenus sulfurataquae]